MSRRRSRTLRKEFPLLGNWLPYRGAAFPSHGKASPLVRGVVPLRPRGYFPPDRRTGRLADGYTKEAVTPCR